MHPLSTANFKMLTALKCCALINQRLDILGSHYLDYEDLALLHWRSFLRLAKASKRFWISGLRNGPIM